MVQFIAISIIVFLVVILSMVTMLLVAKRFLSPSGNVNIEINGDKTITVPQGSSASTCPRPAAASRAADSVRCRCLRVVAKYSTLSGHTSRASKSRTTGDWDASAR